MPERYIRFSQAYKKLRDLQTRQDSAGLDSVLREPLS